MNRHYARRVVAVALVCCILAVGGLASFQSVAHESQQHAHHHQATHSTAICSWMCAAGQVLDNTVTPILIEQPPIRLSEYVPYSFVPHVALDSAASRGPPLLPAV